MIRMVQRRLIIPRGDTGSFSIPYLKKINQGDVAVFTIFDVMTHTKLFQKVVAAEGDVLNIAFSHNETVNLQPGKYLWDIKIYTNPQFVDDKLVNGEEIDSYYAGFSLPECEIRETGDSLLMSDDTPQAKLAPDQIDLISAAITATQTAKEVAVNSAADAETSASTAATSAQTALESKDAALASQTSAATSESNAAESAAAAQESATRAAQIAQQIHEEIPTKVSDLVDDSGHYTKPATGIPASDLEETYLTSFTEEDPTVPEWAKAAQKPSYTPQEVGALPDDTYIPSKTSDLVNDSDYAVDANYIHTDNNYTTAEKNKLEGIAAGAEVNVNADWNAVDGDAFILNKPTNVSAFNNDVGYLTEHQDISGKANSADLAAVATSGSYEDLSDKPTIPEVPVQDVQIAGTSILANGIANINPAGNSAIKQGTGYAPIVPSKQHTAAFYGLSKAAGADLANEENITVGTYPAAAKTAIQNMLDVPSNAAMTTAIGNAIGNINSFDMAVVQALPTEDISTHTIYLVPKTGETNDVYDEYVYINDAWEMVGNTQIDLSNYVQKTDYASTSNAGVVRLGPGSGLSMEAGIILSIVRANDPEIKTGTNLVKPIVPVSQHRATFYGLAKAAGDTTQSQSDNEVGTYTNEAKAAIRSMIGAAASADVTVQDVQVNGTSILENGVANVPIATANQIGVIKVGPTLYTSVAGSLNFNIALPNKIKEGQIETAAITPYAQHESAFYGLAKAAGDTTQSQSDNAVGQYTDEAKAAIQTMLDVPAKGDIPNVPVQDVQVNGASVLQDGVANVPIASNSTLGVVKINTNFGTNANSNTGELFVVGSIASEHKTGTGAYRPVVPKYLHSAVYYGLAKAAGADMKDIADTTVGVYPNEQKAAIQNMLGITDALATKLDATDAGLKVVRLI